MSKQENLFCWWKHGVIYHIYPQSYQDTNNDGTGDLEGIIQRLDYLSELGIDAIWLSPIYDSPLIDGGYDIKDYLSINPLYGSMGDFKRLLKQAHRRGIRVIMDMVLNHTSKQHPWFIQSSSSQESLKRKWYIWRPAQKGKKPNNWITNFFQSAWTLDPTTDEYYYHSFFSDQPDLNWRNPEVKDAMLQVLKHWLDLGIDGFRLDVINMLFKHSEFKNHSPLKLYFSNQNTPNRNQPEVYTTIKEIRTLLDAYDDKVSIGEIYAPPPGNSALANSFLGNGTDMLHLAFDFSLIFTRFSASCIYRTINKYYASIPSSAWPCFVLSNHDLGRNIKPHGLKRHRTKKANILATLLLTLKGTPFIYYGDEIGMENAHIPRKAMRDRYGKLFYPFYKGRDRYRTPMQWDNSNYAGFSTTKPWMPIHPNYLSVNVEKEESEADSFLNLYKRLIAIRKQHKALQCGDISFCSKGESGVLIYRRIYRESTIEVLLNFTSSIKYIQRKYYKKRVIFSTTNKVEINKNKIKLEAFGAIVCEVV